MQCAGGGERTVHCRATGAATGARDSSHAPAPRGTAPAMLAHRIMPPALHAKEPRAAFTGHDPAGSPRNGHSTGGSRAVTRNPTRPQVCRAAQHPPQGLVGRRARSRRRADGVGRRSAGATRHMCAWNAPRLGPTTPWCCCAPCTAPSCAPKVRSATLCARPPRPQTHQLAARSRHASASTIKRMRTLSRAVCRQELPHTCSSYALSVFEPTESAKGTPDTDPLFRRPSPQRVSRPTSMPGHLSA